ncbi:hypothetical protein EWB00_006970 [Schistosoma japonicum]|uniref:Uncharacterized protein n=2 Tax=Schistosoma japonicum TaxID=6182 RepID=A0A4Z2CWD7_SCHJA|nr:hypothetical protein EWB00_006970 [Schistosoma japonicum]
MMKNGMNYILRNLCIKLLQVYMIMGICIHFDGHQMVVNTAPIETYAKDGVKFLKPCPEENYRYHNATGYFLCIVETAPKCVKLCQQKGCNDLFFMSVIPSKTEKVKRNYRCRCLQDYHFCFYNPLPRDHKID